MLCKASGQDAAEGTLLLCLDLRTRRCMAARTGGNSQGSVCSYFKKQKRGVRQLQSQRWRHGSLRGLCAVPHGRASTGMAGSPSALYGGALGEQPPPVPSLAWGAALGLEGGWPCPWAGQAAVQTWSLREATQGRQQPPFSPRILLSPAHVFVFGVLFFFFLPEKGLFPSTFPSARCLENRH